MKRRALLNFAAVVVAGLWGAYLGLLHVRGDAWFLDSVEATMVDARTLLRGAARPPDQVAIVAIDDETARIEGKYPLSRATLGQLIDGIQRDGPKAVAVDILLLDAGIERDDMALAQALRSSPAAIAAAAVFTEGSQSVTVESGDPSSGLPDAESFLMPPGIFADAAATGIINVATDPTGTPRFVPLLFRSGERVEPSLSLRVAAMAAGADPEVEPDRLLLAGRPIATDRGYLLPLNFYGPRGTIHTVSASVLLAGQERQESLRDRVVVVGSTVTGGGDVFPTPFDPVLPGVEVVATSIANLLSGDALLRSQEVRRVDAVASTLLPMVLVGLIGWRRSTIGFVAMVAVILVWVAANVAAFVNGIWLNLAVPLTAAGSSAILFGAVQIWLDRSRAQHFASQSELLQRVQAPGLGTWLAKHRDFLSEPVQGDAAVVFIDLSGFTGLSESRDLPPPARSSPPSTP